MSTTELIHRINGLNDRMQRSRERIHELAEQHAALVAELAAQVGVTEAGRRLGITRGRVHQMIQKARTT